VETIQDEIAYSNRLEDFWVMELAEQLGVSRQAVSRWELGQTLPDIPNLLQLCELFGVSTDYLMDFRWACFGSGIGQFISTGIVWILYSRDEKKIEKLNEEIEGL